MNGLLLPLTRFVFKAYRLATSGIIVVRFEVSTAVLVEAVVPCVLHNNLEGYISFKKKSCPATRHGGAWGREEV
jgi:hypothetical protein